LALQENLHVTVAAVIEHEGRFLIVKESIQGDILYNQPAGHLEDNETLIEAVVRETLEETAWEFRPAFICGIYQWTQPQNRQTFLRVCFSGTATSQDPQRELDRGILEAMWLSHEELVQRQDRLRSPLVLQCVDDYLAGHRYPLDLLRHIP
jgi:8-oxo-dGTP pyrophosphatase MutT (NUDIX family)